MSSKTDLQKALEEAVEKSLPKVAGEMLQERLKQADEFEAKVEELTRLHGYATKSSSELQSRVWELERAMEEFAQEKQDLAAAQLQLQQQLQIDTDKLQLTLLQQELELIKQSREEIKELTATVFKNKVVTEQIQRNIFQPGMNAWNSQLNTNEWIATGPATDGGETRTTSEQ
jgi:chromosome segregation ATPase